MGGQMLEVDTNQRGKKKNERNKTQGKEQKEMSHAVLTTFSLIVWHKLLIIVRYLS